MIRSSIHLSKMQIGAASTCVLLISIFTAACKGNALWIISSTTPETPPVSEATKTPPPTASFTPSPTSVPTLTPIPTKTRRPRPSVTPTPTLAAISADNITKLQQIYQFGSGEPLLSTWWPDDKTIAYVTKAEILLYDGSSLEHLSTLSYPNNLVPAEIALSPDGRSVAFSEQSDSHIYIWDTSNGQINLELDNKDDVESLAISPDGSLLASGSAYSGSSNVRLWDLQKGNVTRTLEGRAEYLTFDHSGELLISSGSSNPNPDVGRIWELSSGRLTGSFPYHFNFGPLFLVSKQGRIVFYNTWEDEWIQVRDARSGKLVHEIRPEGGVGTIILSSDGGEIIELNGNRLRVWSLESGNLLRSFDNVYGDILEISTDNKRLITTSGSWDLRSGQQINSNALDEIVYRFGFSQAVFSPDGKMIATPPRAWQMPSGKLMPFWITYSEILSYDPSGKFYFFICHDKNIISVCKDSAHTGHLEKLTGEVGQRTSSAMVNPGGSAFALAHTEEWGKPWRVTAWDLLTNQILFTIKIPGEYPSLAFSMSGDLLAIGSSRTIKIVDATSGEIIEEIYQASEIHQVAFSPDGVLLATAGENEVYLWETETFQRVASIPGKGRSIAFSPDGSRLAMAGWTNRDPIQDVLQMWDVVQEKLLFSIKEPWFKRGIGPVRFSADGTLLLTSGLYSQSVEFLDAKTGSLLHKLDIKFGYRGGEDYTLSTDDRYLAVVGKDGTVRVYAIQQ